MFSKVALLGVLTIPHYVEKGKPLLNNKILHCSKLKAEKMKFVFERVENIVEKGENAGYQQFLLFPQCLEKTSYTRLLSHDCVVMG